MKCILCGKTNFVASDSERISFFRFPKCNKKKQIWNRKIKSAIGRRAEPKIDRICQLHFRKEDIDWSGSKPVLSKEADPVIDEVAHTTGNKSNEEELFLEDTDSLREISETPLHRNTPVGDDNRNFVPFSRGSSDTSASMVEEWLIEPYNRGSSGTSPSMVEEWLIEEPETVQLQSPIPDCAGRLTQQEQRELPSCSFWEAGHLRTPEREHHNNKKVTPAKDLMALTVSPQDPLKPRENKWKQRFERMRNIATASKKIISHERKERKSMQQKIRRLKYKVSDLRRILKDISKNNLLNRNQLKSLKECEISFELMKRLEKKRSGSVPRSYPLPLKKFALTLHFLSPRAYNYVRDTFQLCLPHPRTLTKWYHCIDGRPGFTQESFRILELLVKIKNDFVCNLCINEMYIRKHIEFDGTIYYGYETLTEGDQSSDKIASQVIVFMLVAINGHWKIPLGYFFIGSLGANDRQSLLLSCIHELLQLGVNVANVTFDGAMPNITMATGLGCNFLNANSRYSFLFEDNEICLSLDPSHMIKLVRNSFAEADLMFDEKNRAIDWSFVVKLHELQEKEELHCANKLTKYHINFQKQKMKVRLATQVFSSSVGDAIEYCRNVLQLPDFSCSEGTVRFIRNMDSVFDILNSRSLYAPNYKQALCKDTFEKILGFANYQTIKLSLQQPTSNC